MSTTYLGELEDKFPDELIIGVDEAGVGPLAGPLTAAAVVLDLLLPTMGINDSKKLAAHKRGTLAKRIRSEALFLGECMIPSTEVDSLGVGRASSLAKLRAVQMVLDQLAVSSVTMPPLVLVDGDIPLHGLRVRQHAFTKGDARSWSIAAASIIAKEMHDDWMRGTAHRKWPEYGFDQHMGYGTQDHLCKLVLHGPCPIHRVTFRPVSEMVPKGPKQFPGSRLARKIEGEQ